jgi:RNA-binding protein
MSLTGKARAALRADAHHLDVKVHVGHQGLTPALVASLDDVLRTHELVKSQVAKGGDLGAREAANMLAERLGADVVQVIGRTFTLYRHNPDLPRTDLPAWKR